MKCPFVLLVIPALLAGCATTNTERGPEGTIAYYVQVEASEPDVRIEANNDYIGKAPLSLKIFDDKDGTFHNFGSQDYVIRAFPNNTNQTVQTKVFATGRWFAQEDKIPKRIRTTNVIERTFVEVRRRIRKMCAFTTRSSCERILYAVFKRMNDQWTLHPLKHFTQIN